VLLKSRRLHLRFLSGCKSRSARLWTTQYVSILKSTPFWWASIPQPLKWPIPLLTRRSMRQRTRFWMLFYTYFPCFLADFHSYFKLAYLSTAWREKVHSNASGFVALRASRWASEGGRISLQDRYRTLLARTLSRLALQAVRIAERSKALRSGRSLSGGVGSNPTSDKSFPLVCGETLDSLSPPRCRPRPPF